MQNLRVEKAFTRREDDNVQKKDDRDYQTFSLFLILGLLTLALVFLFKLVLFGPALSLTEMATRF